MSHPDHPSLHHEGAVGPASRRRTTRVLVSHSSRHSSVATPAPSLADVLKDTTILDGLPLTVIVDLRRQVSHLAADLDAAIFQAVVQARKEGDRSEAEPDRLLTPEAAAERFGVTKRWLLDHADEMPGVKRLSRKIVRFSERRLARFLDKTPV